MDKEILEKIGDLEKAVKTADIAKLAEGTEEWGGADVVIAAQMTKEMEEWIGSQPMVISFQRTAPRRRLVLTRYSRELSWLFFRLKDIFYDRLDYITKYDFYGLLAQAALDHLERNDGKADLEDMLLEVIEAARGFELINRN